MQAGIEQLETRTLLATTSTTTAGLPTIPPPLVAPAATVAVIAPPGSPTGVVGVTGNAQVSLRWIAPTATGGAAISDYVVQVSTNNGSTWTTFADGVSTTTAATVTGLTNGTSHVFRVAAVNAAGTGAASAASAAVVPRTLPGAPTSVAGVPDNGRVSLTWAAPTVNGGAAIADYIVQVSATAGSRWTTFADGVSTATSATVTGLTNGTSYVFRVAAVNAAGTGIAAATSAAITPRTLPGTPTGVTGKPDDGRVTLTWAAPTVNGGAVIADYIVQVSATAGSTWTTFADGVSAATSATVTGLTNGTSYAFRIAAVNAAGTGIASAASAAVVPRTLPGAPTNVAGTPDNGRVTLTWAAPTANGGVAISDYVVQWSANNGTTWTTFADGISTATAATVTGLANGTSYVFRVAATNAAGTGIASATSAAVVPRTLPGAPTGVTGKPDDGRVTLTWAAPTANGGATIVDYVVQWSANNGSTWTTFADGVSTATSATVTGLTNGVGHLFRVAAVNAAGAGAVSAATPAMVPRTVPGLPTNVGGIPGNGQVSLTWAAPAANGGAAISDYLVQVSADAGATWTTFADAVSAATSATVTGLANGSSYAFRIAAVNIAGTGIPSAASAAIVPRTLPGAPTSVTGVPDNGRVSLAWAAPAANGGAAISDYVVQVSANNGSTWTTFADGVSTATSAMVTGLTNNTAYVFRVAAVNAAGTGATSANSTAMTPRPLPGMPTGVAGTAGNGQVTLAWAAPAAVAGVPAVIDYIVQVSGNGGSTWATFADGVAAATSATVTGLTNGASYVFRVAAVNVAGTGTFSPASASLTPRTVPGIPTGPVGTPDDGRVSLTWTAPSSDGGAAITDYVVQASSDSGATWATFVDGVSTATTATVTGLTNGTSYVFRVAAVNAAGTGSASNLSAAITPRTVPGIPTGPVGTPDDGRVSLTWTAPTSDGGAAITDYVVQASSDSGATWATFVDGVSTATTATVTGLTNGTSYVFRVAAVNVAGTGSASNLSAAITPRGNTVDLAAAQAAYDAVVRKAIDTRDRDTAQAHAAYDQVVRDATLEYDAAVAAATQRRDAALAAFAAAGDAAATEHDDAAQDAITRAKDEYDTTTAAARAASDNDVGRAADTHRAAVARADARAAAARTAAEEARNRAIAAAAAANAAQAESIASQLASRKEQAQTARAATIANAVDRYNAGTDDRAATQPFSFAPASNSGGATTGTDATGGSGATGGATQDPSGGSSSADGGQAALNGGVGPIQAAFDARLAAAAAMADASRAQAAQARQEALAAAATALSKALSTAHTALAEANAAAAAEAAAAKQAAQEAYAGRMQSAEEAYSRAVGPLQAAYDRAVATAWKVHEEANAAAARGYAEARAAADAALGRESAAIAKDQQEQTDAAKAALEKAKVEAGTTFAKEMAEADQTYDQNIPCFERIRLEKVASATRERDRAYEEAFATFDRERQGLDDGYDEQFIAAGGRYEAALRRFNEDASVRQSAATQRDIPERAAAIAARQAADRARVALQVAQAFESASQMNYTLDENGNPVPLPPPPRPDDILTVADAQAKLDAAEQDALAKSAQYLQACQMLVESTSLETIREVAGIHAAYVREIGDINVLRRVRDAEVCGHLLGSMSAASAAYSDAVTDATADCALATAAAYQAKCCMVAAAEWNRDHSLANAEKTHGDALAAVVESVTNRRAAAQAAWSTATAGAEAAQSVATTTATAGLRTALASAALTIVTVSADAAVQYTSQVANAAAGLTASLAAAEEAFAVATTTAEAAAAAATVNAQTASLVAQAQAEAASANAMAEADLLEATVVAAALSDFATGVAAVMSDAVSAMAATTKQTADEAAGNATAQVRRWAAAQQTRYADLVAATFEAEVAAWKAGVYAAVDAAAATAIAGIVAWQAGAVAEAQNILTNAITAEQQIRDATQAAVDNAQAVKASIDTMVRSITAAAVEEVTAAARAFREAATASSLTAADAAIQSITAQATSAKAAAAATMKAEQEIADAATKAAQAAADAHMDAISKMASAAIEMVRVAAAEVRTQAEGTADAIYDLAMFKADARRDGIIDAVTKLYKADKITIDAGRDASHAAIKALAEQFATLAATAGDRERAAAANARDEAVNGVIRQCHARIHEAEEIRAAQANGSWWSVANRFGGVMEIVGSLSEVAVGFGAAAAIIGPLAATGIAGPLAVPAALFGIAVGTHGLDALFAGARKALSGNDERAYFSTLMDQFTGDPTKSDMLNAALSAVSTGGGAALLKALGAVDDLGRCASMIRRLALGLCFTGDTLVHVTAVATDDAPAGGDAPDGEPGRDSSTSAVPAWRSTGDTDASSGASAGAGSSAALATLPATRTLPIRDVPLGCRVLAANPRPEEFDDTWPEPEQATWVTLGLALVKADGTPVQAEFLRPRDWVDRLGIRAGAALPLAVTELDIHGDAVVTRISPCPPIATGEGRVVTGRFVTTSAGNVVQITLADGTQLRATDVHPVWSVDREDWVPAGELEPSALVDTLTGPVAVRSIERLESPIDVYNIEVHGEHVFRVTGDGVLVHNACPEYSIGTYSQLRKVNAGSEFQVHHLIEQRFRHLFNQSAGEMVSQVLSLVNHQAFTNAWRQRIPYGQGTKAATAEQVLAEARIIYANFPDVLKALGL